MAKAKTVVKVPKHAAQVVAPTNEPTTTPETTPSFSTGALLDRIPTDSESVISMILGALVVLVIGALIFSYVQDWRKSNMVAASPTPAASTEPVVVQELPKEVKLETNAQGEQVPSQLPAKYTVKAGDSTWKIAEAFYGSGFNYVDIEMANNLKADQELNVGQELMLPKVAVRSAQQAGNARTSFKPKATTAPKSSPTSAKGDDSAAEKLMK